MLEDVRGQMNVIKMSSEGEIVRLESRLLIKLDDAHRNTDKYDRVERRIEELGQAVSKRFTNYEDEFQRDLGKLSALVEV